MRPVLCLTALALVVPATAQPASPLAESSFIGTAINVNNVERSVRFYTQALGLKVAATLQLGARSETILHFPGSAGQPALLLMHDPSPAAPAVLEHGNGFSRLVLRVADLTALSARLREFGYQPGEIRAAGQSGYRVMMINDPDGFRLELVQQSAPRQGS